jgi:hypothetical protein
VLRYAGVWYWLQLDPETYKYDRELQNRFRVIRMYADRILTTLTSAYLDFPREVLALCRYVGSVMAELGSSQTTINEYFGSMLFQRYICPAIINCSPNRMALSNSSGSSSSSSSSSNSSSKW